MNLDPKNIALDVADVDLLVDVPDEASVLPSQRPNYGGNSGVYADNTFVEDGFGTGVLNPTQVLREMGIDFTDTGYAR